MRLVLADYEVQILEGSHGNGVVTRVLARLEEAVTYALLRAGYQPDM